MRNFGGETGARALTIRDPMILREHGFFCFIIGKTGDRDKLPEWNALRVTWPGFRPLVADHLDDSRVETELES